jgi:phosphate transport system substrate-binding protein
VKTATSNFKRFGSVAAIAIAGTMLFSGCAANEEAPAAGETTSDLSGTLSGSGASSQLAASDAWIKSFQTANPGVTINYAPDGSGAGRAAFIAGGVAYAGSDSSLSDDEIAGGFAGCVPDTGYIEVPVYISPIAVVYNVEGVDELNLDSATLAGIFTGAITTWDDAAIVALNPDAKLPSAPITAVHRSDDSGTTKNFADYLGKTSPTIWTEAAADPFPTAYKGEGAQKTAGVIDAVTNGQNTIGYADASAAGDLGVAKIKVGDEFVEYSPEAAAAVVEESPLVEGRDATDLAIKLDRDTTDPTHYPIVLVSYAIACQEYTDKETGPLVKAYLTSITSEEGQSTAADAAGSAPLSSDLSAKVATALDAIK